MSANEEERDAPVSLFNAIYDRYHRSLYAYLLGRCGEREAAADLLQETCLRVWRHIAVLDRLAEERRRFWLFGVASNVVTDYYRRRSVRRRHEGPPPAIDLADEAAGDAGSVLAVEAAIANLPEDLRLVLVMRAMAGMSSGEIGEALGRPAGTVRYQLTRARRLLAVDLGLAPVSTGAGGEE